MQELALRSQFRQKTPDISSRLPLHSVGSPEVLLLDQARLDCRNIL